MEPFPYYFLFQLSILKDPAIDRIYPCYHQVWFLAAIGEIIGEKSEADPNFRTLTTYNIFLTIIEHCRNIIFHYVIL